VPQSEPALLTDGSAPVSFTPEELAPMLSALTNWVGGDVEILLETLPEFLTTTPAVLESLRIAITRGDAPSARRAAHTVKGLLASFAVPSLAEHAARIEDLAATNVLAEASAAFAVLAAGLEDVYAKTKAIMDVLRSQVE
jgi:HPt (histidine-containing phosphotransfer) domain-containing protein